MTNKTLSSWTTLRDYLTRYIDRKKDWDNEDLNGYDVLNDAYNHGKITSDQFAEGKTALGQYLADVDADRNYRNAAAQAENNARKETARQDYLNTRLASYLPVLQGNAGQAGYQGLTGGQAIALRNNMAQQQADIGARKQTALAGYLQTYQDALRDNSAAATDQYTTLAATREQERQQRESSAVSRIKGLLYGEKDDFGENITKGMVDENGNITQGQYEQLMDYLKKAGADDSTLDYWKMTMSHIVKQNQESRVSSEENVPLQSYNLSEIKEVPSVNTMKSTQSHKRSYVIKMNGETKITIDGKNYDISSDIPHTNANVPSLDTQRALNQKSTGDANKPPVNGDVVKDGTKVYVFVPDLGWRIINSERSDMSALN